MALQAWSSVPQQTAQGVARSCSRTASSLLKAAALGVAAIFMLAAQSAFAQHGGGGGHAGGGGGGHFSGGGHASSGGASGRSSSASTHASAPRSGTSSAAPGASKAASSSSRSASAAPVWHGPYVVRLGSNSGASADAIPSSQRVIPYHVTIGFPPKATDTSALPSGYEATSASVAGEPGSESLARVHAQPVTYYGVGDEAWSEPARTSSAAPSNAAFVTAAGAAPQHAAAHASPPAAPASVPRSSAPATASPRPAPVRSPSSAPQTPRVISGARTSPFVAGSSLAHAQGFPRNPRRRPIVIGFPPIYPIYPFGPFGFGGFGYGGGYFGYGLWPWWFDNGMDYSPDAGAAYADPCAPMWLEGCDAYYSGNGAANGDMSGDVPADDADSIAAQKMEDNEHNVWLPPDTPAREQNAITAEKSLTVLYLKDGTVYAVSDFWVADGKLVYDTSYGAENSLPLDQLDLEQTVKANAARGVPFTLKSKPGPATAPGGLTPVPNPQQPQPQPQSEPDAQPQN
jgi:hypothetical protein